MSAGRPLAARASSWTETRVYPRSVEGGVHAGLHLSRHRVLCCSGASQLPRRTDDSCAGRGSESGVRSSGFRLLTSGGLSLEGNQSELVVRALKVLEMI